MDFKKILMFIIISCISNHPNVCISYDYLIRDYMNYCDSNDMNYSDSTDQQDVLEPDPELELELELEEYLNNIDHPDHIDNVNNKYWNMRLEENS